MAFRRGPMSSGERNRIVTLQQRSATDAVDTAGFPVETWTTLVAAMPASRVDITGREQVNASQQSARQDTRWEMNYIASMDPELVDVPKLRRLVHQSRVYDIVAASVIGRRDGIELVTLAKVG